MKKVLIIILVIVGVVAWGYILGSGTSSNIATTETNTEATETTPEDEPGQETTGLATRVDAKMKEIYGIESYSSFLLSEGYPDGSHIGYISNMEDVSSGTVRVLVQEDLTKDEAKRLGISIMGNAGYEIKELEFIVVRGTNGLDHNVSRNDIPALR